MSKYIVIEKEKLKDLEGSVNAYMADGWELQGGISTGNGWYSQAMIKAQR